MLGSYFSRFGAGPLSLIITIGYVFGNILTYFRYFSRYPREVSSHHHPSNYYYIRPANKYLQSLSAIPAEPPPILLDSVDLLMPNEISQRVCWFGHLGTRLIRQRRRKLGGQDYDG